MSFGQQAPGQYPHPGGGFQGAPQGFPAQGPQPQAAPYPYPPQPARRGGLIAFGIALLLYLLLELVLLVSDVVKAGPSMLGTLFGLSDHYAFGPVGFYPTDLGICVVLAVSAFASFTGRDWGRFAAMPLIAVFTYGTVTGLLEELTASNQPGVFSSTWYTYLNLMAVAEVIVGLAIVVGGALAGPRRPAAQPQQYQQQPYGGPQVQPMQAPAPVPPQQQAQQPYPSAPPQQAPQQVAPQAPQQPYGYGYPQPPAQPPQV